MTLQILHDRVRLAVRALVEPVAVTMPRDDGGWHHGINICLVDQLVEAIASGLERSAGRRSGQGLPICVAAIDLYSQACESPLRAPGMSLKASIVAIPAHLHGNEDEQALNDGLRMLIELRSSIEELFSPTAKLTLEVACPTCNTRYVERIDDLGELVKSPALVVDAVRGAECRSCNSRWSTSQLTSLAETLGINANA